jgi:hypothetical protein
MPVEVANELRFVDLLKKTNSRLASHYDFPGAMAISAKDPESAPAGAFFERGAVAPPCTVEGGDSQPLYDLLDGLKDARAESSVYFEELRYWHNLTPTQKQALREQITSFAAHQTGLSEARAFLCRLTHGWPASTDLPRMTILVIASIALAASYIFMLTDQSELMRSWSFIYVIAAVIGFVLLWKRILHSARASWIRDHFFKCAADNQIDRRAILEVLEAPVNQNWDRTTIHAIIALRPFKLDIENRLEQL